VGGERKGEKQPTSGKKGGYDCSPFSIVSHRKGRKEKKRKGGGREGQVANPSGNSGKGKGGTSQSGHLPFCANFCGKKEEKEGRRGRIGKIKERSRLANSGGRKGMGGEGCPSRIYLQGWKGKGGHGQ